MTRSGLSLDEHDERLLRLVDELGWHDLDFAPAPPAPAWRPDKSELSAGDRKLLDDVETHGWHSVHVHPYPDREPYWTFTVGLPATRDHPELIVFGLDADVMHAVLTTAVTCIEEGQRYRPGHAYEDEVVDGYPVRFLQVRPHWYGSFLGYAQWFHESAGDFEVLQLVWPDRDGRWPWEPSYSVSPGAQPLLGAP